MMIGKMTVDWKVTKEGITNGDTESTTGMDWGELNPDVHNGVLHAERVQVLTGNPAYFIVKVVTDSLLVEGDYRFTLTVEPSEPIFGAMSFDLDDKTTITDGVRA